jgi:hypothetical protein
MFQFPGSSYLQNISVRESLKTPDSALRARDKMLIYLIGRNKLRPYILSRAQALILTFLEIPVGLIQRFLSIFPML